MKVVVVIAVVFVATFQISRGAYSPEPTPLVTAPLVSRIPRVPQSVDDWCHTHGGLLPHPLECQAYYNCSYNAHVTPGYFSFQERYLMDCPYPQLFSTKTLACEHFEKVVCGDRREPKSTCDYVRCYIQCGGCLSPRCDGMKDGVNMNSHMPWTPHYVICYKERVLIELSCPKDTRGNLPQLFSPDLRACVTLDRIPSDHYGLMPNCTGKDDGRYPNEHGRCNFYTECLWGQYKGSVKCDDGKAYDEVLKECTTSPKHMCTCDPASCGHVIVGRARGNYNRQQMEPRDMQLLGGISVKDQGSDNEGKASVTSL